MDAALLTWLPIGLVALIILVFAALRLWTVSKQRTLNAEEFRQWFQKNFLGMETDSVARPSPEDSPASARKASATSSQDKPSL